MINIIKEGRGVKEVLFIQIVFDNFELLFDN